MLVKAWHAGKGLPCDSEEPRPATGPLLSPSLEDGNPAGPRRPAARLSERRMKDRWRFGEGEESDSPESAADIMSAVMMSAHS